MLPFVKYITKSNIFIKKQLFGEVNNDKDDNTNTINKMFNFDSKIYQILLKNVKDTILMNFAQKREDIIEKINEDTYIPDLNKHENNLNLIIDKSDALLRNIFNSITTTLATNESNNHLINAQYGNNVNIKAYWKRCGFEDIKPRGAVHPDTDTIRFQFEDIATYQIKCDKPLKPVCFN